MTKTKTTTTTTTVTVTETAVALAPDTEGIIARFNEVKNLIKELEAEKSKIDTELREMLGEANVGTINGVERLRIVLRNNSKIDRDALKTAWPEAFEATLVQTPYTILQTK
jgi:predicted phage-related endonuclease